MKLSNYKDFELIAILRSLLSTEKLLSLRKVEKTRSDCFNIQPDRIGSIDELRSVLHLNKEKNGLTNCISVKGIGSFLIATSAKGLETGSGGMDEGDTGDTGSTRGRMQNKVVIITGGAQGFGAGIAECFFREGANLVIGDLNEERGEALVADFNARNTANKALFVRCDVSDLESVDHLVNESVLYFGGLDVMVSNAGILRAGGLDEMTPETFELMTMVNYNGYFNCAKASARMMKIQASASDHLFFDILQINSKSGLAGSNRNFAYAGGKFGGIGLTQSFALELMPHRIKVNSICPGNFFEGPLWSDPDTGLFVQYLKAGKVPGAKSVEDVKRHYEAQVPAGRGCRSDDVARAAFYAIEQEYETGQAIPVTGGQIMLH